MALFGLFLQKAFGTIKTWLMVGIILVNVLLATMLLIEVNYYFLNFS